MPSVDTESHFKFLLSCIRHSAAGKINFGAVADELNIVSKAAAAKRYERLLKAHDITPQMATPHGKVVAATKESSHPGTPIRSAKRRKLAPREDVVSEIKDDEEEDFKADIKKEKPDRKNHVHIKKEVPARNTGTVSALVDEGQYDNDDGDEFDGGDDPDDDEDRSDMLRYRAAFMKGWKL
ncbi:hypothetical protein B0T26DRAFT_756058 [Lasiosphaeria miniovina]|uniref:Myb-like DNA-binding domain-containing protein n=1 Tax=Lasiosphaeria miniovina TaxID=1954250 RepID=A0AA40DMD5_9PEZI|nr:uncharacterized protein B0T26DRAFT_756058 [Lasiosphaeria miniovina]KAK0706566.1 hypothetical protein B0T26DRAFT_756058 [Lasiosphaeria miniovina]